LISKERLNEYVKGDFAARVKLKLLSPAKATAMTVGGCGKVNFKSTSNEEADLAAQPPLFVAGAREATLGVGMCPHGYIATAASTHMPENGAIIRCMLDDMLAEPLRVHTTTGPDGREEKDGTILYDVGCQLGINTQEIFAEHHGTSQASNKTRPDVTATPEQVSAFKKEQADSERARLSQLTVDSLRDLCSKYGSSTKGLKPELLDMVQRARSDSVTLAVNGSVKDALACTPVPPGFATDAASAAVAAVALTYTINPPDVVRVRLYNQPVDARGRGVLYDGVFDCARKMLRTEGAGAFFKGVGASMYRTIPHVTLTLAFIGSIRREARRREQARLEREWEARGRWRADAGARGLRAP
jgi:hypothetical protein